FFGSGWQLDDYNAYYQPEKSELPLYGNIVRLKANGEKFAMNPAYFAGVFLADADSSQRDFYVRRDVFENRFHYPKKSVPAKYEQDVPYKTDEWLTATLLGDTLGKKIIVKEGFEKPAYAKTIYSVNADTLYRHMLQPSDNFMAEQLLLVCSSVKFRTLSTDSVISYATRTFLDDLPDKPQWADGSGLSRQDLFTPRSLIALLQKISAKKSNEKLLLSLIPEGGKSGTLRSIYTSEKTPFIWAKTGSLSNVHNQSGYVITRKGHKLAYSFMNNNFTRPTREIRNEMVRIMTAIHDKF
ncbi:MAG: D-alanyl-D-alanine carboxypeptidase, partial [Mucilaginibacter polytrichastri]|nr:D-alanyl-D-alanine carboxypeptidase [Mucilaginibacter polytrichastri]